MEDGGVIVLFTDLLLILTGSYININRGSSHNTVNPVKVYFVLAIFQWPFQDYNVVVVVLFV